MGCVSLTGCPKGDLLADFGAFPKTGGAPLTVDFTDRTVSNNNIKSRTWQFGDGQSSGETSPRHTYPNPGWYTVTLTARTRNAENTTVKENYIAVLGWFDVRIVNTGDYPISAFFMGEADSTVQPGNRLKEPIAPGEEFTLDSSFRAGQHIVGASFDVDGSTESTVVPGNMSTVGLADDVVTVEAYRDTSGAIGIDYRWGT